MVILDSARSMGTGHPAPTLQSVFTVRPGAQKEASMSSILFVSLGASTDAGGVQIVVDANGRIRIVHVPGWEPEVMAEVAGAVQVLAQATRIKDAGIRKQFQQFGESVIQARSKEIAQYVQQAG